MRDSECEISAFIVGDVTFGQEPLKTEYISPFIYSLRADISNNITSLYSSHIHCMQTTAMRNHNLFEICSDVFTEGKGKVHPCTGTEALYRPYGP